MFLINDISFGHFYCRLSVVLLSYRIILGLSKTVEQLHMIIRTDNPQESQMQEQLLNLIQKIRAPLPSAKPKIGKYINLH